MDLSGSMQGAGGVGGLLAVKKGTASYYPTYDGNGNITEYLNANKTVVAHYEYDPFGNTTTITGPQATTFTHRFSTKPLDATTGLYYYGYRYYDPATGRWPSRDPIGERGGVNLYGFVGNDGIVRIDVLGLWRTASDQKFRTDSAPPGGEYMGDPTNPNYPPTQIQIGPVDPEFIKKRHTAKATAILQYLSTGQKCGNPMYLSLYIETGNNYGTEMYFDQNRFSEIVSYKSSSQIIGFEDSINYNNTVFVKWEIPTHCVDGECVIDWSNEGYGLEFSTSGDSQFLPEGSSDPTSLPSNNPRPGGANPNWQFGIDITSKASLIIDSNEIVTSSTGSVELSELAPQRK